MARSTKIADRLALNAAGEDQSDYTEAVCARYVYLATGKTVERDFSHIDDPIDRAFAIEGFHNKVGHAANVRNAPEHKGASAEVINRVVHESLDAFMENISEGGWTNREGGNEVNLKAVLEAFAELRSASVEDAAAAWETYTDEQKTRIRTNPRVKAIVARKRAEKAAAMATNASASDLPTL
jgi:hypothetical protein